MNDTIPEARMRDTLTDVLRELEVRVVNELAAQIELEHMLIGPGSAPSCRHEIATRRTARVLGTLAAIMGKIQEAAR